MLALLVFAVDHATGYAGMTRVRVRFGPGKPLIKLLIDEICSARGSVDLATEALQNAEIIYALRYKAEAGFRVRVVIDTEGRDAAFSRADALVGFFDEIRAVHGTQTPSVVFVDGVAGTMMATDTAPSPVDGKRTTGRKRCQPLRKAVVTASCHSSAAARVLADLCAAIRWSVCTSTAPANPTANRSATVPIPRAGSRAPPSKAAPTSATSTKRA